MSHQLETISLTICNYKSFKEVQGFEKILPVNLIIGRNNSGKSALLDLIAYACEPSRVDLQLSAHKGAEPVASFGDYLRQEELQAVFEQGRSGGAIHGDHWHTGKQWLGKRAVFRLLPKQIVLTSAEPQFSDRLSDFTKALAQRKKHPFTGLVFRRLAAERDIIPETDGSESTVLPNGRGLTNIVQQFLNKANKPRELIEKTLLAEFNSILKPDQRIEALVARQHADTRWELFFREPDKGWIPLSASGSGIKTILLALVFLNVLPKHENNELSQYLFGFEELENNLHPALQRRLLRYLRDMAVRHNCILFLTTHSSVAIDLFARDDKAQILHVTHDGRSAFVKNVVTYVDNKGILDDLDVRASDLLQANGIVWVEGPSDRLYFNHWIKIWSEGKLVDGVHYQCMFYGGKLLAHFSADSPDLADDLVKILRVNRNALVPAI